MTIVSRTLSGLVMPLLFLSTALVIMGVHAANKTIEEMPYTLVADEKEKEWNRRVEAVAIDSMRAMVP